MRWQLRDPELRRKAWPDYTFGCKRILFSSHFLPALARPNVELVTDAIERVTPERRRHRRRPRARGRLHHLRAPASRPTTSCSRWRSAARGGRTLREAWADGAHAHLGHRRPGLPVDVRHVRAEHEHLGRLDHPLPGGAGRATSARRCSSCATAARRRSTVRPEVEAASDREVQARFAGTAWTRCDSWYRDDERPDRRQLARLHARVRRAHERCSTPPSTR